MQVVLVRLLALLTLLTEEEMGFVSSIIPPDIVPDELNFGRVRCLNVLTMMKYRAGLTMPA